MSDQPIKFSSVSSKLISGFSLLMVFSLLYLASSYFLIDNIKSIVDQAINKQFNTSILISKLAIDGQKLRRYEKEYFIYINNSEKRRKYSTEWSEAKSNIQNRLEVALLDETDTWSATDKIKLKKWLNSLEIYAKVFSDLRNKVRSSEINTTIDANSAIREGKNAFRVFLKGTDKLGLTKFEHAKTAIAEVDKNFFYINIAIITVLVLGFIFYIMTYVKVTNAVNTPLNILIKSIDKMSKGQLDQIVQQPNIKEFQEIYKGLEQLRIAQQSLVAKIMNNKDSS